MTLAQQEELLASERDAARSWMKESGYPGADDNLCDLLANYARELRAHHRPLFDLAFDTHGRHRGFTNCYEWLDSLLAKAKTLDHLEKLRNLGWMVAVHNDYKLPPKNGMKQVFTFWLFTHPHTGRFVKGEGETDLVAVTQALISVLEQI